MTGATLAVVAPAVALAVVAPAVASAAPAVSHFRIAETPVHAANARRSALRGLTAGASAPALNWTQLSPATSPPGRYNAAMAYDPAIGQMVLFGGVNSSNALFQETWTFDGSTWTEQSPAASPPALYGASMAYAPNGNLFLYGGVLANGSDSDATYFYRDNSWYEASVTASPPPLNYASMVYDPTLGDLVLFGGFDSTSGQTLNETWIYAGGSAWTELSPPTSPPARYSAQMVYDPATKQVVLFGGSTGTIGFDDTWTFNGSTWTQHQPAASPPADAAGSMVYDAALSEVILFGGEGTSGFVASPWAYNGSTWVELSPAASPPARVFASMDYDPAVGLVLFGGGPSYSDSSVFDDTWAFYVAAALTQTSNTLYDVTQGQIAYDLALQGAGLVVSGASGPVTYTTTISSPYVSVSSSGAISALASTPAGDYAVSGTDADEVGNTGSWTVELQVGAAPVLILPGGSVLPGSTVGDAYSQQFSASLSAGPYTWSVTAGTLPPGLTFSSGGLLSGTTTKEGNYSFTIQAEDTADDYGASVATSIAVAPASLTVDPSSLPGAVSGYLYTANLELSGAVGTATFELASGSLPSGLTMSSVGVISGTPSGSGLSTFSVTGTDGDGFSTTASYQVLVEESTTSAGITISPATLPSTAIGSYYDQQLSASGGTAPYSWAVTAGEPPEGFAMTSGGLVHGHWNEGESGQFTVMVTDSTGAATEATFDMVVQSQGVLISPAALAVPTIDYGQSDPQVFTGSGGTAPYSWQNVGGSLPYGMSLSLSDDTLTLEGTAQQSGTFTFTLNVADADNNLASQTYTLTVNPAPTITVNHTAPWSCTVGVLCATQLKASGGTAPYTFALQPGEPGLPAGFTLSPNGLVKGTATPAEVSDYVYDVNLLVTDADTFTGYLQDNFYVVVPHHLKVSPSTLPDPVVGQVYNQLLSATGGGIPYTYAVTTGALPAGLYLDTSNGDISGTPTTPGPVPKFTITATDANGYTTSASYRLAVLGAPTFTSPDVAVVKEGLARTKIAVTTAGSYPTPLMLISGALPAGLNFTAGKDGTATITGKTTAAPGSYPVTVTADNLATGEVSETLTIWVYSGHLLPASKVFYPGESSKYTITTQIPADLISITGEPSWVTIAAGKQADQIVVSGAPPDGTSVGTYPTTVTVTALAPPAKPPTFNIIVGA
jgi:hypothetical protein